MNAAPSTGVPRAARRTSCLGTFLLVVVLWSFSVVALATYLVTRSAIVRQVRFAWWAVFLAAAALLGIEAAIFEATGDGLPDLLRLHIHPWWLLAHGYGIGSLITWPMTIVACQAPLSLPVGAMVGSLSVARAERLAAGAEWSPYSQRHALVSEVHAVRQVARATGRHHEPTNPAVAPALGIAYPGGDLYPWLRQRGRITEVVIPDREQRLAMAVLGIPGSGKTFTLQRRVWIAARAGMRVIFVDCKGTDPGLAWQVTCAYRLANPGAIVGFWPTQPLDCWRGDGMAIANRLLAVEDWAAEGGGVYYRRMATLAIQLACTPPSGPPRSSADFLRRLDVRKLQQLWRGDPTAQADLEQLAADPQVLAGVRGRYSAFFRSLQGKVDGYWGLEDVDLAVLTIPTIASRTDADAAVRLVLEDLGHFATRRKARVGDDVLLVLDEFSAVQGGTDQAIHLAERLRDVGVPVIFGAQSPEGLGDERQQWRLLHTIGGGLVLHQTPDPDTLIQLAGTVRVAEQAWQLDAWGPAGQGRCPNQVGGLAVVAGCRQGQQRHLVRLVQGGLIGLPQLHLGWRPGDALGHIDRLGRVNGRRPQGAGFLLHLRGHGRLQHAEFDGSAALDEEGLAGMQLADLVGIDPGPVGHVHAGLAGRPCQPPRALASCLPCAAQSPTATRQPSPPSSKRACASNPAGTPPTSCSAFEPFAGGAGGDGGPASPAG
jgi:hypothetical protein